MQNMAMQNMAMQNAQNGPAYAPPARPSRVPLAIGLAALAGVGLAGMAWMNGSHSGPVEPQPTSIPSTTGEPDDANATGSDSSSSSESHAKPSGTDGSASTSSDATDAGTAAPVETAAITPIATPSQATAPKTHAAPQDSSNGSLPGERYPETRSRYLSPDEVQGWSYAKVRYALNEMYARHGLIFQTPGIRQQFAQFSWYHPTETDQQRVEASFNAYERANRELLAVMRDAKKGGGE